MDKLPPELLMKIARYSDFAEVCALSKANRRWNEVIESNWNSLQTTFVESIEIHENQFELYITCEILHRDGRRKSLNLDISKSSAGVHSGVPTDTEKFIEGLLTPIFRSSTFRSFELIAVKSSTLQVLIALLERFRPRINYLNLHVGRDANYGEHKETNVKELENAARIVELSKPTKLSILIDRSITKEEVGEHFLKMIANIYIPRVSMSLDNVLGNSHGTAQGPIPKCRYLVCVGSEWNRSSVLAVPDMIDLVEEWSNNKRDIVNYKLYYFHCHVPVFPSQFEQALKERNLPVQFEVMKENKEFLIKKIVTRGDKQDELRLLVGSGSSERYCDRHFNTIIIRTNDDDSA